MPSLDACLPVRETDTIRDAVNHAERPSAPMERVVAVVFARISRAAPHDALEHDQPKFVRACGLSEWLPCATPFLSSRAPILAYEAIIFATGFRRSAIVEQAFN